jgi:hypothetical protein
MEVERRSGLVSGASGGDVERLGAVIEEFGARQIQILERIDRLVQLNEEMWDHHLQFCGRLMEKVTRTEMELVEAQTELGSQLDALRGQVGGGDRPGRRPRR